MEHHSYQFLEERQFHVVIRELTSELTPTAGGTELGEQGFDDVTVVQLVGRKSKQLLNLFLAKTKYPQIYDVRKMSAHWRRGCPDKSTTPNMLTAKENIQRTMRAASLPASLRTDLSRQLGTLNFLLSVQIDKIANQLRTDGRRNQIRQAKSTNKTIRLINKAQIRPTKPEFSQQRRNGRKESVNTGRLFSDE